MSIAIESQRNSKVLFLYSFLAGLLFAVSLALFSNITAIWACDAPGPFCEETPGGGGGGGNGGGGGGGGGGSNDPGPQPPSSSTGRVERNNAIGFQIDCSNWNGSGSFQPSANCNTSRDAVRNGPHGDPRDAWGYQYQGGGFNLETVYSSNMTCGPSGSKSAYAQTWLKWLSTAKTYKTEYRKVLRADGVYIWAPYSTVITTGQGVYYQFSGCVYPIDTYQYTTCFWNFNGTSQFTTNRTQPHNTWAKFQDRSPQAGDPGAPGGGSGGQAPYGRCADGRQAYVYVAFGIAPDKLGYYSVSVSYNYKIYTRHAWAKPGGPELYSLGWTQSGTMSNGSTGFWAYSCRPDGDATEGRFGNQGSLPNRDGYLNPAACPQVTWQCVIDTPTTIGLERNAVLSGTTPAGTTSTVMRNGQKVNVDFSRVRVIDTSTPNDIDVTNGSQAPSIRNVRNIEYQTHVPIGSTPFFGNDANSAQQYFKYYVNRGSDQKERFDQWISNNNSNLEKAISFNWASESPAQAFRLAREYRVSAEFYIPGGNVMGSEGAGGNLGYQWKAGTYSCRNYQGRGQGRVDVGPLIATSNPVDVLRSTNK